MEYLLDFIHRDCVQWRFLYDLLHSLRRCCSIFFPTCLLQWLIQSLNNKTVLDHRSWFHHAASYFQESSRRNKNYLLYAFWSCSRLHCLFGLLVSHLRHIKVQSWHQAIQLLRLPLEPRFDCSIFNLPLRVQLFIYWVSSLSRSRARQKQGENAQSCWNGNDWDNANLFDLRHIFCLSVRFEHIVRHHD